MPDENNLHFNAIEEGTTAKEAYDDFMAVVEAFRADFPDEVAELHFDISFDLASFLAYNPLQFHHILSRNLKGKGCRAVAEVPYFTGVSD